METLQKYVYKIEEIEMGIELGTGLRWYNNVTEAVKRWLEHPVFDLAVHRQCGAERIRAGKITSKLVSIWIIKRSASYRTAKCERWGQEMRGEKLHAMLLGQETRRVKRNAGIGSWG